MMSDGIPVTDGPLDSTGVGGVLSASPLMVPESITGDPIATDPIGKDNTFITSYTEFTNIGFKNYLTMFNVCVIRVTFLPYPGKVVSGLEY